MQRPTLSRVKTQSKTLPDRIVIHTPPGWGKTSLAAHMPKAVFLMSPGEDRLKKLIEQGLVPPTPHFEDLDMTWDHVLGAVRELLNQEHDHQTLVIDTVNGLEPLAQADVCREEFHGEWGDKGFALFNRGERLTVQRLWLPFLRLLDELREARRMRIVFLCHTTIRTAKNTQGADYERDEPGLSRPAWAETAKWADMVLRGAFDTDVGKDKAEGKFARTKAKGGEGRLLYTSANGAYEAKNVHGLPAIVDLGDESEGMWPRFLAAFPKKPKPAAAAPEAPPPGANGRHHEPAPAQ